MNQSGLAVLAPVAELLLCPAMFCSICVVVELTTDVVNKFDVVGLATDVVNKSAVVELTTDVVNKSAVVGLATDVVNKVVRIVLVLLTLSEQSTRESKSQIFSFLYVEMKILN